MNHILTITHEYLKSKQRGKTIQSQGYEGWYQSINQYAKRPLLCAKDASQELHDSILSGVPMLAARFGAAELQCASAFAFDIKYLQQKSLTQLCQCAGFFPNKIEYGKRFNECLIETCNQIDLLGIWGLRFEEYYIKNHLPLDAKLCFLYDLEPWRYVHAPWTSALKGKHVLVIHPFEETIFSQYANREKLFPGTHILPSFSLTTLKAVQTIAGQHDPRFSTWFDALEWMYTKAMKLDFEVAILGCGAYGMPLASMLKKAGKQAIHLGGSTQILFGIRGKRWDMESDKEYIRSFYNDSWVYPNAEEKPKNADIVEGGCYW